MDIDLEIECGSCGCLYKEGFLGMRHGRMLKCPFCMSTDLSIINDTFIEDSDSADRREAPMQEEHQDRKYKV